MYIESLRDKYERAKEQFEMNFPYEQFITYEEFEDGYYDAHENDKDDRRD